MFKVEVIGNIGADAEVKDVQGNKFVSFRVAHSTKFRNQQGQDVDEVIWVDCTMNDTEAKIIPYLKAGVKVFVRGNASLRVYSSPKLKMMVAGIRVSVWEIELCGGQSDSVPRQLIDPSNGQIFDVNKYYWVNKPTNGMKEDEFVQLIDKGGREYLMNYGGFVQPVQVTDGDNAETASETASESAQAQADKPAEQQQGEQKKTRQKSNK